MSITFVGKFGKRPMHFFGVFGTIMFIIGFLAALWIGVDKLIHIVNGTRARLIAENPFFFIALTVMIIGTQLFLAGFIAELVSRNAPNRNQYMVEQVLGKESEVS